MEQGLLDLGVELSTRNITAGSEFALYVVIANPFSKPVWIHEVNVTLPTDLRLAEDRDAIKEAEIQERLAEAKRQQDDEHKKQQRSQLEKLVESLSNQLGSLNHRLADESNPADKNTLSSVVVDLRRSADKLTDLVKGSESGSAEFMMTRGKVDVLRVGSKATRMMLDDVEVRKIEVNEPWQVDVEKSRVRTVKLRSSLPDGSALQPGSTAINTAILIVHRSIMFAPATYRLQFFVNYTFDSPTGEVDTAATNLLTNRIAHELSIRPPIHAVITGAVIGGIIGSFARLLQLRAGVQLIDGVISIGLAAILSGMAVVFLARKSDAQSFVSVEDFWGGMLMGFLVGYTGTSFFSSLTGISANPAP